MSEENIKNEIRKNIGKHHDHDMPDPEKIKEILDVVSDRIPGMLKELSGVLYSPGQAKQFAESVALFYKGLIDAGMTPEQAYELTNQYMSTLNIGNMFKGMKIGNHQ